jgi:CRP-like cAMP-binding protein
MGLSEKQITEKVEDEGAIRVLVTFEMVGKPQQHVEDTLQTYVTKIKEDPNIDLIDVETADAQELEEEEGFFSAFSEIEMLVPQLESITSLSVNLMPASIEILAPDHFTFNARQAMNWQNDLLARLHEISQQLRGERQKVRYLSKNMAALIQNTVTLLLANGPKTTEQLAQLTGIPAERLAQNLAQYQENNIITQEGDKWQLSSNKK